MTTPSLRASLLRVAVALGTLATAGAGAGCWWLALPGEKFAGALPPPPPSHASLAAQLRADVTHLCTGIGERSYMKPRGLTAAADWLAQEMAAAGLAVERQRFEAQAGPFENVVGVRRPPAPAPGVVVVGAHYDSFPGTVGADDNASGVAAMLAIARAFQDMKPAREVRFVAFATEESHFQTDGMGAWVYARRCRAAKDDVVAMLSLETMGTFSDEPGSQRFPLAALGWLFPDRGDFVAFVADPGSRPLLQRTVGAFRRAAAFPSEGAALPPDVPGVGWSDHWAFWQEGYPAVMVSDTAPFRNPRYHTTDDTPEKLDYDRLARVTLGLVEVVGDLATP